MKKAAQYLIVVLLFAPFLLVFGLISGLIHGFNDVLELLVAVKEEQ